MKIIPELSNSFMVQPEQRVKIDTGALCFFSLGMFLAASFMYQLGLI